MHLLLNCIITITFYLFGLFKYLQVNYLLCDLNAHIHSYSVIAKSVTLWLQIYGLTFELSAVNGGGVGSCTQCRTLRPCQSCHTQCKYVKQSNRYHGGISPFSQSGHSAAFLLVGKFKIWDVQTDMAK